MPEWIERARDRVEPGSRAHRMNHPDVVDPTKNNAGARAARQALIEQVKAGHLTGFGRNPVVSLSLDMQRKERRRRGRGR